jgi:hypothetical protein
MRLSGAVSVGLTGCIATTAFFLGAGWASPRPDSGEAVYQQYCAACHDHPGPRIPSRCTLQKLSVARILHTLDFGVMMGIAYPLQRSQAKPCLANCYFSQDSSGFSVLLPFFDAQSSRSFHPFHRRPGSVARSWRGPFPHCGVASPQAPDPDLESLPQTISQSTRVGPDPRRLAGGLGASHSIAPFRNRSEAFDTAGPS